jgi:prenylcysteine oxidase / farnesylcysteine lyase
MIKASSANIQLNTTVTGIKRLKSKYILQTSMKGATPRIEGTFDTVILAAPLQFSGIDLQYGIVKRKPDEIPYVKLHVTLFSSPLKLSAAYFKVEEGSKVPTVVLTTLSPDDDPNDRQNIVGKTGFFSISTLKTAMNPKSMEKEYIYKIFSPEKVTPELLGSLLGVQRMYLIASGQLKVTQLYANKSLQCPPIFPLANG